MPFTIALKGEFSSERDFQRLDMIFIRLAGALLPKDAYFPKLYGSTSPHPLYEIKEPSSLVMMTGRFTMVTSAFERPLIQGYMQDIKRRSFRWGLKRSKCVWHAEPCAAKAAFQWIFVRLLPSPKGCYLAEIC